MAPRGETIIDLLGAVDNLSDPQPSWNKTTTIVPTLIVFLVVAWLCVIFRLYTRFKIIYSPGWDDLFVVLVLVSGTAGTICLCVATDHGFGQHFLPLPRSEKITYLKLFYVANGTYSLSTALVKIALLLQYLRIFKSGISRQICIMTAIFTSLWGLVYTFMAWVPCFPVQAYWEWTPGALCYAYGSLNAEIFFGTYCSTSAINMVLDIIVLAIPVPLYFNKDASRRTKTGLLVLLIMGGLVNVLGMWRLATIVGHRAATYPTFDPTWYAPISILAAALEVDLATICASVPVFWPVLSSRLDKIFVTQEISVHSTHRFESIDDGYELRRDPSGKSGNGDFRPSSRGTSQTSLHNKDSVTTTANDEMYYRDKLAERIDPLTGISRVESEITAKPKQLERQFSCKRKGGYP